MNIRKAEEKDIPRLLALLGQVLQIHAEIRPDIFIPGTTKYTVCELAELLKQEDKPIYVAVDEDDVCMGYAFCQLKEQPFSTNMVPFKSLFIDDLCIDKQARGQHRVYLSMVRMENCSLRYPARQPTAKCLTPSPTMESKCWNLLPWGWRQMWVISIEDCS